MQKDKEIALCPRWKLGEKIRYQITRKDYFSYLTNERAPIERTYCVDLKVTDVGKKRTVIEAVYPDGFLYLLTSFQSFGSLLGKEKLLQAAGGNRLWYTINREGEIEKIKAMRRLKEQFKAIEAATATSGLKKKRRKAMREELVYFTNSKKEILDYLSRDIALIHRLYGRLVPLHSFHDYTTAPSKKEIKQALNKLSGKEYQFFKSLNHDYKELDFVATKTKKKQLIVTEIAGMNLLSVAPQDRHDLDAIRTDYRQGKFKIKTYHNITLHQTTSKFDLKTKQLNTYLERQRTISDKMRKIMEIRISRHKADS